MEPFMADDKPPRVGMIMGSQSDWDTIRHAAGALNRSLEVIIAGAGGAAHLPGMTAAILGTRRPDIRRAYEAFRARQTETVPANRDSSQPTGA